MDSKTARESVIKPKLIEILGATIANALLTHALVSSMQGKTEQERIRLMVAFICSDHRVIELWGASQTERQKKEWLALAV